MGAQCQSLEVDAFYEWDRFVMASEEGTFFHLTRWQDLIRQKEELLESMGQKLWKRTRKGDIQHPRYEKPLFKLKKYMHLLEGYMATDEAAKGTRSLWGKLQNAAGIKPRTERQIQLEREIRGCFIALAQAALQVHLIEGIVHDGFHGDYWKLDQLEQEIETFLAKA